MIEKQAALASDQLDYVLSDETPDRVGDVIDASGWDLRAFKNNPVALFGHEQGLPPIGRWENLRIEGSKLLGRLVLAAKGTHPDVDGIVSLIKQGILKAVSVGFKPLEREPIKGGGWRYKRQELLEASVVNVPANPNALRIAKSLNISDETIAKVFGEPADDTLPTVSRTAGKPAEKTTPKDRGLPMSNSTLSKRIQDTQGRISAYRAELEKNIDDFGDEPNEDQNLVLRSLNEKIAADEETLGNLIEAEKRLGSVTVERGIDTTVVEARKAWAAPAQKVEPVDYIFRSLAAKVVSHIYNKPLVDSMKALYGEDVKTKAVMDRVIGIQDVFDNSGFIQQKAAVAPADTATSAWAGALVQTAIGDFFGLLMPDSVYPRLSALGQRFGFGRNGTVSLPTRSATPTVAGSFVAEGAPIPVRKAGFTSVTLTPKKMAVITAFTREITERSTPEIEQLLRNAIQEDTAVSIDSVLLDATAASTVRPGGLRNGITTAAGTAGGGFAAVTADLKGMLTTLVTNTNGNIRQPVFIMNPIQSIALGFVQNAGGDLVFKEEISNGRLNGYPVIQSGTVPAGVVILVDAADFFSANGDDPRFDVSDQTVLHMDDTTPLAIGTAGSPNVVAAPVQSMFQTDCLALRMILPMSWAMRRTGVLVERTAVTW